MKGCGQTLILALIIFGDGLVMLCEKFGTTSLRDKSTIKRLNICGRYFLNLPLLTLTHPALEMYLTQLIERQLGLIGSKYSVMPECGQFAKPQMGDMRSHTPAKALTTMLF